MNFGSMEKRKIAFSEPKDYLGRPGKGLITSLGIKAIRTPNKKEARYEIIDVRLKDISKTIKEFDKLT